MTTLARKLSVVDYFALGFGTMVGVGWLVLMDDWLGRGGPLGAILGFALGGLLLLPIGYVYGQWVQRLPDAAGEAAYAAQVFPPVVSYFTGWVMLLAYFIVCPWEAVAAGKIATYIFPSLNSVELYRVASEPVFLPRLVLGIAMTLFLAVLNYRGIRLSAVFQNWTTSMVLLIFVILLGISVARGKPANLHPLFRGGSGVDVSVGSILLTLQIVPYFMTGFESVPKCAEEASPGFRQSNYFKAIATALLIGALFYALSIAAVAYISPWQSLVGKSFATAIAFERSLNAKWPVTLVLVMALFGLFQCFNGNFIASSRLLFAFGRRGTIPGRFGAIHSKFQTPHIAIVAICAATIVGLLLGDALLVPITEVGSMASAFGWLAACISLWLVMKRPLGLANANRTGTTKESALYEAEVADAGAAQRAAKTTFATIAASASGRLAGASGSSAILRLVTASGIAVSFLLLLMKIVPLFPGHFSIAEWITLCIWLALGLALYTARR